MAGTYIGKYDTTAASNSTTGTNSVSVAEGMLPSNINNAFRDVMADIRQWYNNGQWVEYGDGAGTYTATYVSATAFTIDGVDVTSVYHANRRIKLVASSPGTIYGTVSSTSFSTNTTVNVTWDSGSLSDEAITSVYVGIITSTNDSIPTGISAAKIGGGNVSSTEFDYLNGVTSVIQTQINAKQATITGSATTIDTESLTASRAVVSNAAQKIAVSATTDTELGYVSGVTSAIQTQLDAKQATITGSATTIDTESLTASRALISNGSQKVAVSATTDTELGYVSGVTSAIQTQLDAKQATITGSATTIDTESLTANRAVISNGSQKIAVSDVTETELGYLDGVSSAIQTQMDTKATTTYVDNLVTGLKTRILCEAASTANVTIASALENGDTLDGVTLATGDRVLLKDQSTGSQNGVYTVVASGAASRDTDFNTISELSGQMVIINQGTSNDNTFWLCTTDNDATLDSDSISFTKVTPSNSGTVTSVGLGDAGSSEFTIASTPVTSAGTITIGVNSIGAAKIADGTVSDAEYQRLDGVTSDIQTQLDAKGTLSNVSEDSTPQLGGDLDVVTYDIVTTSNRDIDLTPHGTGNVVLKTDLVSLGGGSETGHLSSNGAYDLKLDTNSSTNSGSIVITDGANGAIDLTTNGTGAINFNDLPLIPQQALTSTSGAVAWDAQAKPNAYHLTTENTAISEPSNAVEGAFICIEINYNGSHTMGWNAIFNFAADTPPTTTDTDGKTDILSFRYNGAIWQEIGRTLNIPES